MGVNCAALGDQVLDGELFGYERGAFTGAVEARPGLFEAADGGTVFLDEIGELPQPAQAKLLRVLEERAVRRIGARSLRPVDVRIVAATNRDLSAEVQAGRFRQDLFYRLSAFVLQIPPLRERKSEIAALVRSFVARACEQQARTALRVSDAALQALLLHDWPGNVRELENAIERAVVLCTDEEIGVEHLPRSWINTKRDSAGTAPARSDVALDAEQFRAQIDALERTRILDALEGCAGNQTRAAQVLGMSRRTLVNRLGQLGLPRPKAKPSARRPGGS
jgi:DNA-binding NtrC family response regulator